MTEASSTRFTYQAAKSGDIGSVVPGGILRERTDRPKSRRWEGMIAG